VSLCMTNVNALFVVNAPAVRTTLLVAVVMTADKLELSWQRVSWLVGATIHTMNI